MSFRVIKIKDHRTWTALKSYMREKLVVKVTSDANGWLFQRGASEAWPSFFTLNSGIAEGFCRCEGTLRIIKAAWILQHQTMQRITCELDSWLLQTRIELGQFCFIWINCLWIYSVRHCTCYGALKFVVLSCINKIHLTWIQYERQLWHLVWHTIWE